MTYVKQILGRTRSAKLLPFIALIASLFAVPLAAAAPNSLRVSGGSDRVVIANAPELNPSGAVTIEAWVRPTTNSGCGTIVGKNYITGYWLGLCSGRIRYYTNGSASSLDGSAATNVGEWNHIAVTFDGSRRVYYMNGIVDLDIATTGPLPVNLDSIGIGGEATDTCGDTCPFSGDIAEVRLWSVARTQAQIRADIVKQVEAPRTGLVAVWHLEGSTDEGFGNFPGTLDGSATFLGLRAPPVGEAPLKIPRMLPPLLDGRCDNFGSALRIPVWNEGSFPTLEWLYVGATNANLYVCIENMPRLNGFAAVYVDPTNDASTFSNPDDFRVVMPETGTAFTEVGTGGGGYMAGGPSGTAALKQTGDEFFWSAEFRIARSQLEMGPDGTFRLQVIDDQDNSNSLSGDQGWPETYYWDWPARYEEVVIDDSLTPPFDGANPGATARHSPSGNPPAGPVILTGSGTDNGGVASITLFLDFVAVRTCDFSTTSSERECQSAQDLAPGQHHFYARVTDFAGRTTNSAVDSFRVVVDADAPTLTVTSSPMMPSLGGTTVVTATARDPSGIQFIDVGAQRCTFTGTNTTEVCTLSVTGQADRRVTDVRIRALDNEGFETSVIRRILFGNTGPDTDGDGIVDAIENVLCTEPDNPDTDGDALSDKWELLGVQFAGTSEFIELPSMGANPCMKDVFLQYDYEVGAKVEDGVIENVVAAYRRNNVSLHVTQFERPRPTGSASSNIRSRDAISLTDADGEYYFNPLFNHTHYYAYSRHTVGVSGAWGRLFTFDIYVGDSMCECPLDTVDPAQCGTSAEPTPTECRRESVDGQTRRFMHELGHTVGMGHGGRKNTSSTPLAIGEYLYYPGEWDNDNHKPNYRSLMNYVYWGNVCQVPGSSLNLVVNYDYSTDAMINLVEDNLDERPTSGLVGTLGFASCPLAAPGSEPMVLYTCADPDESSTLDTDLNARRTVMLSNGTQNQWRFMHGADWANSGWNADTGNGIDWDCDGVIEASVSSNVNGNGGRGGLPLPAADEICGDGFNTNGDQFTDAQDCRWQTRGSGDPLRQHVDWPDLPRPDACIVLYDGGNNCYSQPADYRNAMRILDPSLDCRPSDRPAVDCPLPTRASITRGPSFAMRGDASNPQMTEEREFFKLPPNTEACDGQDNDGDLIIDEGCRDTDFDGLSDATDNCPTVANADQSDVDGDRLGDACDSLEMGPVTVSVQGDLALQLDWTDVPGALGYNVYKSINGGDFEYQSDEVYPSTDQSLWLDLPPAPGQLLNWQYRVFPVDAKGDEGVPALASFSTDDDLDGVGNTVDNCVLVANPAQQDTDGDNYGNACDADLAPATNDCIVNAADLGALRTAFFSTSGASNWNPDADFNSDGVVNLLDLGLLRLYFFGEPGPSGLNGACDETPFASGVFTVRATFGFDVDLGAENSSPGAGTLQPPTDLWFEKPSATQALFVPQNGASQAVFGTTEPTALDCSNAALSSASVDVSTLTLNTYVCARTDEDRLARYRISGINGPTPSEATIISFEFLSWVP